MFIVEFTILSGDPFPETGRLHKLANKSFQCFDLNTGRNDFFTVS